MKKLFALTLSVMIALLLLATSAFATTYDFDSFTDGTNYGTKTKIDENITNLKGTDEAIGGMFVGPFSKASTAKLADGIVEEAYVEINPSELKTNEFFEVSLALRNGADEYVTEAVVMSQKTSENVVTITAGWAEGFKTTIDKDGIYTYRWEMFVENDTPYVNFSVLSGDTVIGTTENVNMDLIQGPDDKTPILEQEEVSVKYLWFCNIQCEEGINVYAQLPGTEIDFIEPEDTTVVVENAEETKGILTDSLTENGIVVNPADTVKISVEVNDVANSEEITPKIEEALAEKATDAKVVGLYDIIVPVRVNDILVNNLTKLSNKIELKLAIPDDLPEVAEGYSRTYYVVRDHNGEMTILDTVVNDDNTISFETDAFSTYALAYADTLTTTPGEDEKPGDEENPPVEENPGDEENPPVEENPGDEENPPAEENPGDEQKPPVEENPGDEQKPPVEENPSEDEKPAEDGKDDTPKTGIVTNIGIAVATILVAGTALVVLKSRKK